MTSRRTRLTAGLIAASLFLAACGDDGDDDASGTDDPTTTTAAEDMGSDDTTTDDTTTDETMADDEMADDEMAGDDIVDTAVAAGDFDTLVAAVQAAGLEEKLRGEGPFTVFAPTDDAFAALPAGTVDTLLADPTGDLTSILTYHVVEGEVLAEDVVGLAGQEVATVNGATFTVEVGDDGAVTLTDAAGNTVNVVQTDIVTSNGVIHVIDAVLMPGA
jgi:uncharacterized surface protein with fasciclin (FAS1) repeats